jgi:hypothetical protein
MFKTIWQYCKKIGCLVGIYLYVLPIYADLPKPPDGDMPSGSNDWIDVGGSLAYKALHYACIILGVVVLVGAAFGIVKAYHVAREKQELGHFFTHGAVAVVAAALGLGLLYAGYTILPSH